MHPGWDPNRKSQQIEIFQRCLLWGGIPGQGMGSWVGMRSRVGMGSQVGSYLGISGSGILHLVRQLV